MADEAAVIEEAQIARVSALVGELAGCDVSSLSQEDFLTAHDAVARLGRLTDTLEARFAGDLARRSAPDQPGGGLARRQGFGNAGMMLARLTGGSQVGALRSIEAGRAFMSETAPLASQCDRLDDSDLSGPNTFEPRFPAVAAAALAGELSVESAGLIASGLESITDRVSSEQLHSLEQRLVAKAVHLTAREVRRMVSAGVASADLPGHEERERRQHAERYLTWTEDHTGMVTLTGKLDPVTAAPLRTVIEQMVTHQFRARRDHDPTEQDQRTVGQVRADALFELCRHALGCQETEGSGIRTTIVVRMNRADLDSGRGLGRIDGTHQPVSVGQLRRLAGDAGIIPEILGRPGEVLDLGRTRRIFTRAQRIALLERDGGCAKCHAPPEHCEAHHIRWWERGGATDLGNGVMLCTRCHHDVHRQGWGIRVQAGRVDFIPPSTIDPAGRPRPGGLAALEIGTADDARAPEPRESSARDHETGEDSARGYAQREDSARGYAQREDSAWDAAA